MLALPNPMKYIKPKSIFAFVNRACHLRGAAVCDSLPFHRVLQPFTSGVYQRFSAHSVCNLEMLRSRVVALWLASVAVFSRSCSSYDYDKKKEIENH